jgi:hypothetical protein
MVFASLSYEALPVDYINVCVTPDGETLFAFEDIGETSIFNSTDHGETWTAIDTSDITGGDPQTLDITSSGTLFVSTHNYPTANGSLWRSADLGVTWTNVLTLTNASNLIRSGAGFCEVDGKILIGEYGNKAVLTYRHAYYSDDDGLTWTSVFTSKAVDSGESYHIHAVYIDPYTYDLYVTQGDKTYMTSKSVDDGVTWSNITSLYGLSMTAIVADEDFVYFGLDSSPWGVDVVEKTSGNVTNVIPAGHHDGFYPTWQLTLYNGEVIAVADDAESVRTTFYTGHGSDVDDWEIVEAYDDVASDRSDDACLSNVDNHGHVYVNTWHSNLWRVNLSQFVSGSAGMSITGWVPTIICFAMLGMMMGYMKKMGR